MAYDPRATEEEIVTAFESEDEEAESPDEKLEETHRLVQNLMEDAETFFREDIEPDLVKATEYYYGRPFGNEKSNRSKVVNTVVRDTTRAQLPTLMRVFFGPETTVEFKPRRPDAIELAKQQTDYVRLIVNEDNPGAMILHSVFKDALVRRLGIVKWYWDEFSRVTADDFTGISEQDLMSLLEDDTLEVDIRAAYPAPPAAQPQAPPQQPGMPPQPPPPTLMLYDVHATRTRTDGRARFEAIPPEEFRFTPDARSMARSQVVAHVREMPIDEVVALGYDEEEIEDYAGLLSPTDGEDLKQTRQFNATLDPTDQGKEHRDDSQRLVLFGEAYVLVDGDDDGIAELRKFHTIGPDYDVLNGMGEIVDEAPFGLFTPDPEPHTMIGLSNYDYLGDLQRIMSQIERGTLDSLSQSLDPVTEVVNGEVNMGDLLKPDASKIVRVRRPGMMREVRSSFLGEATLPVLAYFKEIVEYRTGYNKGAQGLDADALQSTDKAGVAAALSASQQQAEMLAMIFAETGMKQLFKGLLGLVVKHQDRGRIVQLRGKFVEVDPRSWDTDLDLQVNVGLGQGTPQDRIVALAGILSKQETLLQAGSPLVSAVEYRSALARATELAGFKDADEFFRPWGPQDEQQAQQAKSQQPPPPDPAMALVEVEKMKAQFNAQMDMQKHELEKMKVMMQDDRERDRTAREMALREAEIEAKFGKEIEDVRLNAKIQADRVVMDADVKLKMAQQQQQAQAQQQQAQAPAPGGSA